MFIFIIIEAFLNIMPCVYVIHNIMPDYGSTAMKVYHIIFFSSFLKIVSITNTCVVIIYVKIFINLKRIICKEVLLLLADKFLKFYFKLYC